MGLATRVRTIEHSASLFCQGNLGYIKQNDQQVNMGLASRVQFSCHSASNMNGTNTQPGGQTGLKHKQRISFMKMSNRFSFTMKFTLPVMMALMAAALAPLASAEAAGQPYQAGVHYAVLETPVKNRNPDMVEVSEYFLYSCIHCYQMEAHLNIWKRKLPEKVTFKRTPAIWNEQAESLAQIFYTIEALGLPDEAHGEIFRAIHNDQRNILDSKITAKLMSNYGVDPKDFAREYKSFGVMSAIQKAQARGRAWRASGVPTLIVNGKYRIETGMAGSQAAMLEVADYLIERELALLGAEIDDEPVMSR